MPNKYGFTLIELLVSISIIAILAVITLVAFGTYLKNARDTKRQTDLRLIQTALEKYHTDKLYYPISLNDLTKYLNVPPSDPNSANIYLYKGLKVDKVTECSISTECLRYCLYAKLENSPLGQTSAYCPDQAGYNLEVPSPD